MDQSLRPEPYTVEQLQQKYSLSISTAVDILDHCNGDRALIDKMLKRCHQKQLDAHPKSDTDGSC